MNIVKAMQDPKLLKPWFKAPATWEAWTALLSGLSGLPMTAEQLAIYRECTERYEPPDNGVASYPHRPIP